MEIGFPKSSTWESEGQAWSEDKSVSSSDSREGNVRKDAFHVIGLELGKLALRASHLVTGQMLLPVKSMPCCVKNSAVFNPAAFLGSS